MATTIGTNQYGLDAELFTRGGAESLMKERGESMVQKHQEKMQQVLLLVKAYYCLHKHGKPWMHGVMSNSLLLDAMGLGYMQGATCRWAGMTPS